MPESLRISLEARVLRLTLNRPEKRNALSVELCRALVDAFEKADGDPGVGAILVDAEGPVFCAGMDLSEVLDEHAADHTAIHERLFTVGARMTKPIVMAVRGPALAGGTGLVANGHVVIAAEGSTFGLTEIRIAMWPFVVFRSIELAIGERRAVELSLTGRIFGAGEAARFGLVHTVLPEGDVAGRSLELAREMVARSPEAIRRGLEFVHGSRELGWKEAGELAQHLRAGTFRSEDFAEGIRAFREKRAPVWPSLDR